MFYFKFHIGDYRSDAHHLTLLEHGIYFTLMSTYYITEQPLPKDERQLFRLVGARTEEERQAVIDVINEFFIPTETHWVHSRIDFEIKEYQSKAESNRENGKKGGRPKKNPSTKPKENPIGFNSFKNKTQTVSETEPNNNPNISLTNKPINPLTNEPIINLCEEESSLSKPKEKKTRITKKQKAINDLVDLGVSEKHSIAIIEKRNGKPLSDVAMDEIKDQAALVNLTVVEALEFAAKQDWGSFRADWYEKRTSKGNGGNRGTDNFHDQFYGVGQSPFGHNEQQNGMRDVNQDYLLGYDDNRRF